MKCLAAPDNNAPKQHIAAAQSMHNVWTVGFLTTTHRFATLKAWWRGELALLWTVLVGGALYWLMKCLLTVMVGSADDDLYLREWIHSQLAWTLLTTLLMLDWALPVFRWSLNRLSRGGNIWITFCAFMISGYLLLSGVAEQTRDGFDVITIWRADSARTQTPFLVYADPALGRIMVSGNITPYSAIQFEAVVRANPQYQVVQLESLGGIVADADRMAALVRKRGLSTVSMEYCASACTDVFLAGKNRFLGPEARFGFHRTGYPSMPHDAPPSQLDKDHARTLRSAGVAEDFIEHVSATPYHRIWRPTQAEMFAADYATLHWSERPTGW